jgi:hypothetical protein
MTVEKFWKIVDRVNAASDGDMDEKCSLLKGELQKLSATEVASFQSHFDDAMDRAYTWPLWAAAFIMNGGCGDDSFMDFRATLISMGQKTLEQVLADPEALVEIGPEDGDEFIFEGYQYVPLEVFEEIAPEQKLTPAKARPSEPTGKRWEEDSVDEVLPRLAGKYS